MRTGTPRGGDCGHYLESVCHMPPSAPGSTSLSDASIFILLTSFPGLSSHYSTNSKSKLSSFNSGLSIDGTSRWTL